MLARIQITHAHHARRDARALDCKELEARLVAAARRWDDDLARRADRAPTARRAATQLFARLRPALSRRATASECRRARPCPTSRMIAARSIRTPPLGHGALPARWRAGPARCASSSTASARRWCCPTACRCSSTWACACSTSIRTASRRGEPRRSALHDFGLQAPRRRRRHRRRGAARLFEDAFARVFRGEVENDDFNRLVLRRRPAGRRDRRAARLCEVPAGRSASRFAGLHRGDARRASRASRACWSRCSSCASIPSARTTAGARIAAGERDRSRARRGRATCPRTACCASFLALIQATTRTNYWCRDAGPARLPLVQARSAKVSRPARAAADVRDLRVLAALRGRPPARRQGRARRTALVGPAGGFPHRGARAW